MKSYMGIVKLIGASLSESHPSGSPHPSVNALQVACTYVYVRYVREVIYRKFKLDMKVHVHFKFAHVLKI